MTKELTGKVAFVTGSGRGLGRAMAERLAELGADVAIHDLTWTAPAKFGEAPDLGAVAKAIARHGGRTAAVTGNIGDKAAVAKMKEEIEAKLGHVDILVNCAGGDIGASGGKPVAERCAGHPARRHQGADREQPLWHDPGLPGVRAADGESGKRIGDQHRLGRGAFRRDERGHLRRAQGRSRSLHALPRQGAADPGRAHQRREPGRDQDGAFPGDPGRRSEDDGFLGKSLVRYAEAAEIADAVAFLASPRSKFINGQVLRVDGGETLFPG